MRKHDPMIPLEEALRILDEALADVRLPTERVPVRSALGRVLTADQLSRLDLPPFDKSAMDGYAILPDDEREEYRLLETVAAGQVGTTELAPGCAVKVMTGAPVPSGAGRVIMVEHAEEHGDAIRVTRPSGSANICWTAEDIKTGDLIMTAGTPLASWDLANLVSCGITDVEVARRARMAIISTGGEIVDDPELLTRGKIMNANGPLLTGLAAEHGIEVAGERGVSDDRAAIASAIDAAFSRADIVVLSGGVSAGDFDFVIEALGDVGLPVHFSRVAVKPGKPMTFASTRGRMAFGLPGNPVSVYLTFHLFVLRAVALISGASPNPRVFSLAISEDFERRKVERTEYVPGRLTREGRVRPLEYHGSAHLTALTRADGFFVVPAGVAELAAGEQVDFAPIVRRSP